jgi:hypothetical protein
VTRLRVSHRTFGSVNEFDAASLARERLSVKNVGCESWSAAAIFAAKISAEASACSGDGAGKVDA